MPLTTPGSHCQSPAGKGRSGRSARATPPTKGKPKSPKEPLMAEAPRQGIALNQPQRDSPMLHSARHRLAVEPQAAATHQGQKAEKPMAAAGLKLVFAVFMQLFDGAVQLG